MREVHVIPTGVGNLASVAAAFLRLDCRLVPVEAPEQVERSAALVLPGVGHFGAAMQGLRAQGLVEALRDRVRAARPTLAVCLGLQLLAEASEEEPGVEGLGLIPGQATRFAPGLRSPNMGWARVEADPACRVLASGDFYFAHSFTLRTRPAGLAVASAEHGGTFVAAVEGPGFVACQFHPELSGPAGQEILSRWLQMGGA